MSPLRGLLLRLVSGLQRCHPYGVEARLRKSGGIPEETPKQKPPTQRAENCIHPQIPVGFMVTSVLFPMFHRAVVYNRVDRAGGSDTPAKTQTSSARVGIRPSGADVEWYPVNTSAPLVGIPL